MDYAPVKNFVFKLYEGDLRVALFMKNREAILRVEGFELIFKNNKGVEKLKTTSGAKFFDEKQNKFLQMY